MFIKQRWDKTVLLVAAFTLFVFASLRSEMHLPISMPHEFVDDSPLPAVRGVPEKEVAQGYWDCALIAMQRKYGGESTNMLPADAPDDFRITTADLGLEANSDAVRKRYWRKLHQVWYDKGIWVTSYGWDFSWMRNPISATGSWFERIVQRYAPRTSNLRLPEQRSAGRA